MKAKDRTKLKKKLEEAQKQYEEKGYVKKENGECFYDLKTLYGRIIYMFDAKKMEDIFARIAFDFLAKLDGFPTTVSEIKEKHGIPEEEFIDVTFDLTDEIEKEFDEAAKSGITYFMDNLPQLFVETFNRIVEETFCLSILERSGKGYFTLNKTQSQVFDQFFKAQGKQAKERMNIKKSSGAKKQWTEEKIQEAASVYKTAKSLVDEARKKYKQYKKDKSKNRVEALKRDFPQLSDHAIEQIGNRGIEPNTIAIQIVLAHFGKENTEGEYIKQLLRKISKNQ